MNTLTPPAFTVPVRSRALALLPEEFCVTVMDAATVFWKRQTETLVAVTNPGHSVFGVTVYSPGRWRRQSATELMVGHAVPIGGLASQFEAVIGVQDARTKITDAKAIEEIQDDPVTPPPCVSAATYSRGRVVNAAN